ncbi:GNAT family N-acetyltransferase [Paenibacillus silvisoli]|uniref:GNAT family N-acetyltransferase n=1 Tax=Paenibacillus silvisoli TaxID=3110539 RepID=UPI002803C0A5|nr:GNAT family N-acetyltransferase [Paenibacillus silvisoli]
MILLAKSDYDRVRPLLSDMAYHPVFAYSVIDGIQSGQVFVNNEPHPTSALIANGYGVYLFVGTGDDERFMSEAAGYLLDDRNHAQYYDLYASTPELLAAINERLAGQTVVLQRSSFAFDYAQFQHLRASLNNRHDPYVMKRVEGALFDKYQQEMDASYESLWSSSQHFTDRGFGYCLLKEDEFASVCNSMFVGGGYADIDIVTADPYQKQGLATNVGAAFIEHCLHHQLVPNYNCDAGNGRSIQLAAKLGFVKQQEYPMLWWHRDPHIMADYLQRFQYALPANEKTGT